MAQCTATGGAALLGQAAFNFAGFAQGAAVSSLISSINTAEHGVPDAVDRLCRRAAATRSPNQEGGGVWARGIGGDIDTKNTDDVELSRSAGIGAAARQHHL